MMKKYFIPLLFVLILSACSGTGEKHIAGKFYLSNIDTSNDWSLYEKIGPDSYIGVVNATVLAVGHDDNYIIVKQHPHLGYNKFYASGVRYYIVPLKYWVHDWHEYNSYGPLKEDEFRAKRKELKIPDSLDFSIVVKKTS